MTLTHLTPADYVTTQWSGGATTQLAIAPKGAVYADRDFLWRLSSATVELDESDFTPLPAYDRVISTLRGDMVLAHNGGERLTLHPYEIHDFSGADDTHSWGRCTDFNLMLRRGQCRGCVTAHFPHGTETLLLRAGETALLFCGEGSVTLRAGTETLTLAAHESAQDAVDEGRGLPGFVLFRQDHGLADRHGRARAAHRRGQREADACADVPLREGAA